MGMYQIHVYCWWFRNRAITTWDGAKTWKIMGWTTNLNWWTPDFFHQQYVLHRLYCRLFRNDNGRHIRLQIRVGDIASKKGNKNNFGDIYYIVIKFEIDLLLTCFHLTFLFSPLGGCFLIKVTKSCSLNLQIFIDFEMFIACKHRFSSYGNPP